MTTNAEYLTQVHRLITGMIDDLDGNAIVTPDGEVVGNSEVLTEELHYALACVDMLEHRLLPPSSEGGSTERLHA